MSSAPLLHTAHFLLAAEITAPEFGLPPPALTGHLAGLTTGRSRAVMLVMLVTVVGTEERPATTAFTPARFPTHRGPESVQTSGKIKSEEPDAKKIQAKKEEELSSEQPKKIQSEENGISNRRFSSTFIPPLTAQDRKRMLRLLIKDITVEKRRAERKVELHIRWHGGAVETLSVDIPLAAPGRVRCPEALVDRVRSLASTMTDAQITAALNQEGLLSAKGQRFTASIVKWMRYRYEIPAPSFKASDELTVRQVAERFAVSPGVVYYWIERGHLPARRLDPGLPYWITLGAEKEAELRAWIANSNRIKPQPIQTPAASGAL